MVTTVVVVALLRGLLMPPAESASCSSSANSGTGFEIATECGPKPGEQGSNGGPLPFQDYRWNPACSGPTPDGSPGGNCPEPDGCPDDLDPYILLGLAPDGWHSLRTECRLTTPTLTPADVSRAFQRIPLPHLRAIPQPATKTLVNFETIFRVEATPLTRHLTLLGQQVELAITPTSFDWSWGDGTTTTTTSPGAAYPRKDVVHRYLDADVTVHASVTVTWSARWRVNGGSWSDVPGNVHTTGPAATLRVVEAVPRLSETG